ncbi:hypothetical protein BX666DRAFT_2022528 [Dichotomocladium elegans]|nr:hypothetical protein BX666DRAFT_2022528 [Dichotomocladium elegans]
MNLLSLGRIISPRLPPEIVWLIAIHLPGEDILRLIGTSDDATIDRLLSYHPFFTVDRRLHVLLMTDPALFQTYLVPGHPVPHLTYLEAPPLMTTTTTTTTCCYCCGTGQQQQQLHQHQQPCFYSVLQPLELIRRAEGNTIEFAPKDDWWWVRMRGVMGVAVVLTHKNIILKRSLHAVHPARQRRLEHQAYFGGSIDFDHQNDLARVTRCNVSMSWFCC